MKIKLVIIGGVAGGATAAARARRISEEADITVLERGPYVSFANCGLPYHISGDIPKRSKLLLQTPEGFDARYGVKVLVNTEALEIDPKAKRVKKVSDGKESWLDYDKLILAQGANPVTPNLPGVSSPHVFKLWTVPDMDRINDFIEAQKPVSALVVGAGFVGLEMAEALAARGLQVTVLELQAQMLPVLDPDFGALVENKLKASGISVIKGMGLKSLNADKKSAELEDGSVLSADLVLLSIGIRAELTLARNAGLSLGESGNVLVNEFLQTSDPDIYAAGDMVEVTEKVSGRKVRVPLAGPANRQGRIAASNALGQTLRYRGALGTSVLKVFDTTVASTGLSERTAKTAGFDFGTAVVVKDHHAAYYPGAKEMTLKLVYDKKSARILGAQAFGEQGVEKRIDVVAAALQGKLTLEDLAELDLAYSPPYSSANDPVNLAAFIGLNDISGFSPTQSAASLKKAKGGFILDVRNVGEYESGHIAGSVNIPVDDLRYRLDDVPRDRKIHILCRSGFRGHLAQRILRGHGFEDTVNVTGGFLAAQNEGGFDLEK